MKLPPEIQAFENDVKTILSWTDDWLHQDEFDKKANAVLDEAMVPVTGVTILAPLAPPQQRLLFLAQYMVNIGMIEAKLENDAIYYRRIAEQGKA